MILTNADIGNLITAMDCAIAHSLEVIDSASPPTTDIDTEAIAEEKGNLKMFLPLRKRLRAYEKAQLKKHFPKGFPKGRRK